MNSEIYRAYRALACAVMYYVVDDYRWAYYRYIRGELTENIYRKYAENMHDPIIVTMIDATMGDTPDGLIAKIERQVKEEVKESGGFKKLRKYKG